MAQPPPRFSLGTFDVGTILKPKPSGNRLTWHNRLPDFLLEPLMLGPFLSQNQPEPSGNRLPYEPPPGFSLGTFNVGTILKPKTFRKPPNMAQPPPGFSLGTFDVGTILKPETSGNRLTWHNRLPDFLLEPLMLEPFLSQNLQETA